MKGKYKAAIALLLALVLLPLALLLTLTHWVPTLAGIWLPAGGPTPPAGGNPNLTQ